MRQICFLLIFYCVFFDACAQKSTLIFRTDEDIAIRVYKPIDDTYNFYHISDILDLKPNISINYELDVKDFAFVQCRFPSGSRRILLVLPGDRIEIKNESDKITISGSNAEGHKYYNENYIDRGLGYYYDQKASLIFKQHVTDTVINYDSINYYFRQELILPYQAELEQMEMSGEITSKFSSIIAKDLYFAYSEILSVCYKNLLWGWINDKFKPTQYDIQNILSQLSSLYENPYSLSDESKKLPYNSIEDYYQLKYKYSDDKTKEMFTKGHTKDFYGNRPYYLMASDSMQLGLFGSQLIADMQYGTNSFNHEKILPYLDEKFPNSEYVAIIKKMTAQNQKSGNDDEIVIVNDSISSIRELMQIPGIRGKYAYIDLWGTACVPCVFEFQFNDDVHKLFADYNNLVAVYISIDTNRKLWEERVNKYSLKGYNIMAPKSLQEDIGMKVYNSNKVGVIPRYLLLDPEGNIINDNLPRPSRSLQLKPILADALK